MVKISIYDKSGAWIGKCWDCGYKSIMTDFDRLETIMTIHWKEKHPISWKRYQSILASNKEIEK